MTPGNPSMAAEEQENKRMEENTTDYQDGEKPASHQMEAGSIQAIDKQSVHRICSGQVVLTLATAVKELVENSIDAGATTVDIKLKDYGSESIEVTDNGSGVEEKNFLGLTEKHHTSKLSDFNDLINVETFGFRGEALSSLCALSNMTVTTRHKSVAVGTKLEYDANGQVLSKNPMPRQQGTTVCLQNLFHTLPVRHKEFQRNLKKEFGKMVQVLNAYCLINTGVRITCSNQTSKGSRSTVVSTNGNASVRENITNIFGPKQLQSLLPFEQRCPTEEICTDYGIKSDGTQFDLFSIEGFVSKCEHGQGRSSTDRQFLFINRRPCDVTKIIKVVNEVYHSYNRHQYPFVVLLISMGKESVDVNVTPDKRQIFLEGEKVLLATIKSSLVKMYEPTTSVLRVNPVFHESGFRRASNDCNAAVDDFGSTSQSSPTKLTVSTQNGVKDGGLSCLSRLKRSFSSAFDKSDPNAASPCSKPESDKQRRLEPMLTKSHSTPARFSPEKGAITQYFRTSSATSQKTGTSETPANNNASVSDDGAVIGEKPSNLLPVSVDEMDTPKFSDEESVRSKNSSSGTMQDNESLSDKSGVKLVFHEVGATDDTDSERTGTLLEGCSEEDLVTQSHSERSLQSPELSVKQAPVCDIPREKETALSCGCDDDALPQILNASDRRTVVHVEDALSHCGSVEGEIVEHMTRDKDQPSKSAPVSLTLTHLDQEEEIHPTTKPKTELRFSFKKLRECLTSPEMTEKERSDFARSFRAKISPTDNKSAEEELQREISKDMFAKMDVLGQFNLGFIIARNGEDLFIVDQHATDEKYNFEMLQRHTVLQSQQLICPQNLELTASNEVILMDNLDIFKKNGFDFAIDQSAPPMQRVKLKSTPVSKNWAFGKDDIEELIFMLTDSPGVMCRPSRVRLMFASRACRKSIMIGTALNKAQMKKLLCHMGEIEQPWNCPHGRPTMRHLINLNMLPK